ncbi:MAG: formate dehydrogenase accessory sulfurtransferase FdhD [Bacteroidetes bacterium]|nr:formate dehydrogenase accessory sulfurtransferase FdhD [Bacteroidota bacterium]
MATRKYEAKKFDRDQIDETRDSLTIEEALQIIINDEPFTVTMRTPGDDAMLVRGLLHSEGILTSPEYSPEISFSQDEQSILTEARLTIPSELLGHAYTNSRSLLSVSSCGICGKTELEDRSSLGEKLGDHHQVDIQMIHGLFDTMHTMQSNFHESGGTHAAVAFTLKGHLLSVKEDIGRHNAVDKVIGDLILSSRLRQAAVLTVSGRISYEIIIKCFKAGIPFLAAVSAPSSLAVDYAKELGITLFAFCRDQRATCYSNAHRVSPLSELSKAS